MSRALLQQALDYAERACGNRCNAQYNPCEARELATALQAAIDQPEPEPVARVHVYKTGGNVGLAWSAVPVNDYDSLPALDDSAPLYLHPPVVREPLSDKQISRMWSEAHNDTSDRMAFQVLASAIETAHGIGVKP